MTRRHSSHARHPDLGYSLVKGYSAQRILLIYRDAGLGGVDAILGGK